MSNFFVAFAVVAGPCLLVCLAFYCSRLRHPASQWPPVPDAEELERREYDTMLRHRRRAKLEREWSERKALQLKISQQ
jgi:hypothetical protein